MLLMHGVEDVRVPISSGKNMRDALVAHKKNVSSKTFEREGHALHDIGRRLHYYAILLAFLDKHPLPAPRGEATASTVSVAPDGDRR